MSTSTMNIYREMYIDLFAEIIGEKFAIDVEKSCYNCTVYEHMITQTNNWKNMRFREDYSAACYRLINLLKQNQDIVDKLSDENFRNNIAKIPTIELVKDLHKEEREVINIRLNTEVKQKVSRLYICKKCKGNETTVEEYQTRALDESSTLSIMCINCGYVWRKG